MLVPNPSLRNTLEQAAQMFEANLTLAKDYLVGRGFTAETARRFRLGVVGHGISEWEKYAGRLAIPYLTNSGVVQIRFRQLDGDGQKYLYTTGSEPRLFNSSVLARTESEVWVTEGELDAMSLAQVGLCAVAYPGTSSWKPYFTKAFYGAPAVCVVADGDAPGRKAAGMVAKEIGRVADQVRIVEMPDGFDANRALVEYGSDKLKEIVGG